MIDLISQIDSCDNCGVNNRERSEIFGRYVGLQLKGTIVARASTAKEVAARIGRADANLNRWLNGKTEIPLSVLCEVCEFLRVEPSTIVEQAYDRMVFEIGEPPQDTSREILRPNFGNVGGHPQTDLETVELDITQLAASTDNTPIDPTRGEG